MVAGNKLAEVTPPSQQDGVVVGPFGGLTGTGLPSYARKGLSRVLENWS